MTRVGRCSAEAHNLGTVSSSLTPAIWSGGGMQTLPPSKGRRIDDFCWAGGEAESRPDKALHCRFESYPLHQNKSKVVPLPVKGAGQRR